jgi:TonB-dependent SusC/RagA subfamily outer membrane receptor
MNPRREPLLVLCVLLALPGPLHSLGRIEPAAGAPVSIASPRDTVPLPSNAGAAGEQPRPARVVNLTPASSVPVRSTRIPWHSGRGEGAGIRAGGALPIVIVDGVVAAVSARGVTVRSVSGIVDLDPRDIETMDVVKGAAAAALFGPRAAGGIITITTRYKHPGHVRAADLDALRRYHGKRPADKEAAAESWTSAGRGYARHARFVDAARSFVYAGRAFRELSRWSQGREAYAVGILMLASQAEGRVLTGDESRMLDTLRWELEGLERAMPRTAGVESGTGLRPRRHGGS